MTAITRSVHCTYLLLQYTLNTVTVPIYSDIGPIAQRKHHCVIHWVLSLVCGVCPA